MKMLGCRDSGCSALVLTLRRTLTIRRPSNILALEHAWDQAQGRGDVKA